jgi:peptidoglycan/LPS O-acetylase OafA/YrhL
VILLSVASRLAGYREFILLTRCDGFAIGGLLALVFDDPAWATRNRGRLRGGFLAMGGSALAYLAWHIVLSPGTPRRWADATSSCALICAFTTLYASIVGLVVSHSGERLLAPLRAGWLCYLGRISYGLYLYHQIIQIVLDDALQTRGIHYPPWLQATIFAASIAAAAASWHFLERPVLAWKDRFPYEKVPANAPSPAPGVAKAG